MGVCEWGGVCVRWVGGSAEEVDHENTVFLVLPPRTRHSRVARRARAIRGFMVGPHAIGEL